MLQQAPEPIAEDELYDEPEPPDLAQNVLPGPPKWHPEPTAAPWEQARPPQGQEPLPPQPPFPGPKPKDDARLAAVAVALDILSFRLILLLCVLASAGLFACAALWPDQWSTRLQAAIAFSVLVTGPCLYFYRKAE